MDYLKDSLLGMSDFYFGMIAFGVLGAVLVGLWVENRIAAHRIRRGQEQRKKEKEHAH